MAKPKLNRALNYNQILLITINSIIGSGLFFLPAIGARIAGPSSIISWIILALISIYTAMCFAELVSMFPKAGGIYEYSKKAYGKFISFMVGWTSWLISNITTSMLIVGAISYLLPFSTTMSIIVKLLISIFFVLVFNYLAYRGIKTSAFMLITFAIITLSLIVTIILPSLFHINPTFLQPFFIKSNPIDNIILIFVALFFISETFFGIESICFLAEETKEPEKVLPKALVRAVTIIAILAILLVTVSLMVIPWQVFGMTKAPFATLAYKLGGKTFSDIITLWTYLVIIGAAAGWVVTSPRLILAMTRDKLFLPQFKAIHPKYKTPHKAIFFQTLASISFILISFGANSYQTLLSLLVPLVLVITALVLFIVPILRHKRPFITRHYRVIGGRTLPILVAMIYLSLILFWIHEQENAWSLFKLGMSFIFFGIPLYLLIGSYYDKKFIIKVNESSAFLSLLTENLFLPRTIRDHVLKALTLKEKTILEYGCGVGTLTKWLSLLVGKEGKIYALDISKRKLRISKRRVRYYNNVTFIHDKHMLERIHPKINKLGIKVDAIVSIGTISYLQNKLKVLKGLRRILKKDGKIIIIEFDKFFKIIPNVDWLNSDESIKQLFKKAGFDVRVKRTRGMLWEYIFIVGTKK